MREPEKKLIKMLANTLELQVIFVQMGSVEKCNSMMKMSDEMVKISLKFNEQMKVVVQKRIDSLKGKNDK